MEKTQDQMTELPTQLVQQMINYLQEQPYKEVAGIIQQIIHFGNAPAPGIAAVPDKSETHEGN